MKVDSIFRKFYLKIYKVQKIYQSKDINQLSVIFDWPLYLNDIHTDMYSS